MFSSWDLLCWELRAYVQRIKAHLGRAFPLHTSSRFSQRVKWTSPSVNTSSPVFTPTSLTLGAGTYDLIGPTTGDGRAWLGSTGLPTNPRHAAHVALCRVGPP